MQFNTIDDIRKVTKDFVNNQDEGFCMIPKYGQNGRVERIGIHGYGVLCVLYEYYNTKTGRCYPKQETLCENLGIQVRTLQNHLKALEIAGYIRMIPASRLTSNNKYAYTTNEIIIVPPQYINDKEYHEAIDRFIQENKYLVVGYNGSVRYDIGTGKRSNEAVNEKEPIQNGSNIDNLPISWDYQPNEEEPKDIDLITEINTDILCDIEIKIRPVILEYFGEEKTADELTSDCLGIVREAGRYSKSAPEKMARYFESLQTSGNTKIMDYVLRKAFEEIITQDGNYGFVL